MEKEKIAIITARGGSKRIPRKNIRDFCGKSIIAYSIEAALSCKGFDEVMVSTDDAEIAEIAQIYGAKVPFFRSAETSDDYATTSDVLLEVLVQYQSKGRKFSYGCCIYPTAPFVTGEKLNKAMDLLEKEGVDSVISITEFSFPPMRGMKMEGLHMLFQNMLRYVLRISLLCTMIVGNSIVFVWINFLGNKILVMDQTKAILMPNLEVQDIDNEQDWKIVVHRICGIKRETDTLIYYGKSF